MTKIHEFITNLLNKHVQIYHGTRDAACVVTLQQWLYKLHFKISKSELKKRMSFIVASLLFFCLHLIYKLAFAAAKRDCDMNCLM